MNEIIEIYIIMSLALLIFNICFLIVKKYHLDKINPKKLKLIKRLSLELNNYNPINGFSPFLKRFLSRKLKKTSNLVILSKQLDANGIYKYEVLPFIISLIDLYKNKSEFEKSFYMYFLSSFEFENIELDAVFLEKILEFLNTTSLYTFANAMNVIYKLNKTYLLIEAMKIIDKKQIFYNNRLLEIGLSNFKGNKLKESLLQNFEIFSSTTQEGIMNYFSNNSIDISDYALNILNNKAVDDEVYFSAMKYFVNNPQPESKYIFTSILSNNNSKWVKELLAIQGLRLYNDDQTKKLMETRMYSDNWFIKFSAIEYMYEHNMISNQKFDLLLTEDYNEDNNVLNYKYSGINKIKSNKVLS